jgi:patatin-like phospholipase/acyl hydrolase
MIFIVILLITLDICAANSFNILSIDGGGIRGLIPAQAISHMETYAFKYATEKGYTVP